MIIDFQHHFIPWDVAERHGARRGEKVVLLENGKPKFTMTDRVYDVEQQLRDMELAGMDLAALSCPVGWDAPLDECQRINDGYAKLQQDYPNRFIGLAHVPVHEGASALRELDRAIRQLGLRGTTIMAQITGKPLDAPEFRDFFAKTVELDIPIFVHPAMMPHGYQHALDYDLARIIGRELDLSLAVTRVIAGGVFEELPNLKIVMSHFGGGIAAIKERLSGKAFRFGTKLSRSFDEYFDLFYFDMAGFEGGPGALRCALTGIRPEQMVFATDYPQDYSGVLTSKGKSPANIRDYIADIRSLQLPAATKEAMLGGTAARLLKLSSTATVGASSTKQ